MLSKPLSSVFSKSMKMPDPKDTPDFKPPMKGKRRATKVHSY